MGSWVSLEYDEDYAKVPPHEAGSSYAIGGSEDATMNVTYNYHLGLSTMNGYVAKDADLFLIGLCRTRKAQISHWPPSIIDKDPARMRVRLASGSWISEQDLMAPEDADYWAPTPHNGLRVLRVLRLWGLLHPDAKWRVN